MSETTRRETDTRAAKWGWVEACVWNERMLAALDNGVQGGHWYSLIDKVNRPATLAAGWDKVRRNQGAAGVDRISVKRFEVQAGRYLEELHAELQQDAYQPLPVRRVEIPKGKGKKRPLGIPAVKDRVVQAALKSVIEPIFEKEFLPMSYGFRPGRGCKDALREVDRLLKTGYTHVVDADIQSYFDRIPHARLMQHIEVRISDGRVLNLIERYLKQDILNGLRRWTPTQGTPQGAVLSPVLANIYLHPLDVHLSERGYRLVRYADDFVVLCQEQEHAQRALREIREWMEHNGLNLHPEKTHVGDCRVEGEGFEFLGYRFECGKRWVRRSSVAKLREAIRKRTPRGRGDTLERIIEDLNPTLRGWFGYFKHAHRATFAGVDGFVRRRLRTILRKQDKRPGIGHTRDDHQRWPNVFFAHHGLFMMIPAHATASQSR